MRRLADWIEYMEGEGDLRKMEQLGMLLKHSLADRVVLDNLRRLRRMIKLTDPAEKVADTISNAEFLSKMHKSIMLHVSDSKKPSRPSRLKTENSLLPDEGPGSTRGSCSS